LVRACKDIGVPVRNKKWKSLATSGPGPTLLLLNSLFLLARLGNTGGSH